MKYEIIKYKNSEVHCYGTLTDTCDVDIVAIAHDGELIENYVDNWDYENNTTYKNFTDLVKGLIDNNNFKSIEQIQAE
tara:strand:- start:286 stop:519 length:234 start_codon:yes stop_codon:yes gene_type:complete